MNHFWQEYFGIGIVKTSEDFGSQGEQPSNPLLLDWLATEFVRTGWNVKAMQRLIVTSATYRQSSRVTPELAERDPENRLLARGPRFRLPAELIRDNALAVSGLLDDSHRRTQRLPLSTQGLVGGDGFRRRIHRADLHCNPRAGTSTGAACIPFGNAPCRRRRWSLSTLPTGRSARRAVP